MDTFGFPPNAPALMRQPPPTKKSSVTMKEVMKCLPTKHQAGVTIATVYDLTRIFPDEVTWKSIIGSQNGRGGGGGSNGIMKMMYWLYWYPGG